MTDGGSDPRRSALEPAFILHRSPYRETSLLLEAITPGGRIGLVAKGARGKRSRVAGVLQPFVPLWLAWSGRGELGAVTRCEPRPPLIHLSGRELFSAFYANELLMRLIHRHDPLPDLFDAYERLLHQLAAGAGEWALRRFEVRLLAELGYGLMLDSDFNGDPVRPADRYCYDLERGPVPAGPAARSELHGDTLIALAQGGEPEARVLNEAKRLLRTALAVHLGDRPLRSRELFRQVFAQERKEGV